jgi:hypothetical protein
MGLTFRQGAIRILAPGVVSRIDEEPPKLVAIGWDS